MDNKGKIVLIIEDDEKIRKLIGIYLQKEGYQVMEASDGEEGRELFEKYDPCFVIMDLMLPKISGEQLCRIIRSELKSDVPMIMLTAKAAEEDRIRGLEMGADDYVTKPFSPQELVVRMETVLRRTAHRCGKISYRGVTVKPLRGEAKYRGELVPLTLHEFRLLHYFMRHPNQIVTREQILNELYPNDVKLVVDRTVDVHVSKLREKLDRLGAEKDTIETIRGMGYRFAAY
ncbi:response regulator transcription factor [Paenibacillus thermotolerans]|uniref:response regulator transcription factor n=1 Tax=Paenibacillus thermotolerans TaxID=3027807 RepID=UPI002367F1E7|nr:MULTISPECIES: response regulator transcription factor [unclassified Paenibacillus]